MVALLAKETVRADGPWNEKPYSDWDRSDVRRILFESPWARHFTRTKRALEFEVPDQGPSGMELRGYHARKTGLKLRGLHSLGFPRTLRGVIGSPCSGKVPDCSGDQSAQDSQ